MKKRILFSACVLAACFTACTNDDFQAEQNKNVVVNEAGEVIGADLVSNGMSMKLSDGSADTRVAEGNKWEVGDQTGLAWYQFGKTGIKDEQLEADWYKGTNAGTYNDLYANHLFINQDGNNWVTYGDIYQGAYFSYFPFERLPKESKKKVIAPNAEAQTEDYATEYRNKAMRISAQDFIAYDDVNEETLELNKEFILAPMVNILGVDATPGKGIADEKGDFLKKMIIKQMSIANGTSDAIFTTEGTLVPRYLPKAVDTRNQRKSDETIWKELDEAVCNATQGRNSILTNAETSASLTTKVENEDFNLSKVNTIRAFAFPLAKGANYTTQYPSITFTMGSPKGNWNYGTFRVVYNKNLAESEGNNDIIGDLRTMFDANTPIPAATWVKNISGEPGKWDRIEGRKAELNVADFTPTTSGIKSEEQWNDYVDLIDALAANGKTFTNNQQLFQLGGDVEFTSEIRVPENVNVILNTGNYHVVIAADQKWNHKLITNDSRYKSNVVVEEGVTLTVDPETEGQVMDVTSLDNNGIIRAGQYASVSTNTARALDNTDGRVIVEFGAWVYPTDDAKEGVVAYEVSEGTQEEVTEIEVLVKGGKNTNNEYANVNTLIIQNGVVLDLNAKGTTKPGADGGRYDLDGQDVVYSMPELKDVDIEMEGGSVVRSLSGTNKNVKNIIAIKGENTISDLEPLGNITVKDGKLYVVTDTRVYNPGLDLMMPATAQIEVNGGTLYANTDVWVNKVILNVPGNIETENGSYFYIPSEDCLIKQPGTNFTPGLRYTNGAAATTVKNSFEALKVNTSADTSSEANFLAAMNAYVKSHYDASLTGDSYVGFYNDFSKWLVSINRTALDGKTDITSADLALFTQLTGYVFTWGE